MAILLVNDPLPHLSFQKFAPDQRLTDWVQCYWKIGSTTTQTTQFFTEKLYPDAGASLTIDFSNATPVITFAFNRQTQATTFSNQDYLVSIRFAPTGAYHLLGITLHELAEENYLLGEDFTPSWYHSLIACVEQMQSSPLTSQLYLLEQWLLSQAINNQLVKSNTIKVIKQLIQLNNSTSCIGKQLGLTRRTLERRLKKEAGVSPTQLQQFYRLKAARMLLADSQTPITDIALQCGYYDHAHFCHAFHNSTFETPLQYRKRKTPKV
ncbi:helix-turn-helix transcriptional regulator [Pseudoalteromonas sp. SR44-8]|uniref:helix-turn-helix transcriptional regulator n=1 Tax=Pseudoalteromonas sp. SR44-8 TaxID=2760933 RepID=UPI0015FF1DCB|nr:helix-turn-helix transcriptional regulator [Pseudoalteromonas sp. SR44-8]MBB1301813.1 helix-turn-helix transcriptional regulator [Pseudoalteromonas sp. SR44-8]